MNTQTFWITCLLLVGGAVLWHIDPGAKGIVELGWAAVVGHWLGRSGKSNGSSSSGG